MSGVDLRTAKGWASGWIPAAVVVLTLAVFGAVVGVVSWQLRRELRAQIVGRDAQILHGLALWQGLAESAETGDGQGAEWEGMGWGTGDAEVDAVFAADRLNELVGRLKGVFAARLFDMTGRLVLATPPVEGDVRLAAADWGRLRRREPVGRLLERFRREELFSGAGQVLGEVPGEFPVLEVVVPLERAGVGEPIGAVQMLLDGRSVAEEYGRLDRHLWRQAVGVYGVGAAILGVGLGWTFRRLQRVNRVLGERTVGLQRANEELALAAKTSAVGAVTAHLVHGLKNPLAGLQQYVRSLENGLTAEDPVWREAVESTRRMQRMLQEVLRVVQDEGDRGSYALACGEVADAVLARVRALAEAGGVRLERAVKAGARLTNREANLVVLVLETLLTNAIEATPPGGGVELAVQSTDSATVFLVRDEGCGVPEAVQAVLFNPVRSSKARGTGVGLAIAQRLAQHLGARLELRRTSDAGSEFGLTVPLSLDRRGPSESHEATR